MTLRTTFVVGFPGETEADVDELVDFIKTIEFDHVGVFTYSHEEGTAAAAMVDDVPAAVKRKRQRRVMQVQQRIVARRQKARVGQRVRVVVDGPSKEHELVLQGRLPGQAPEVDPVVFFTDCDPTEYPAGTFVDAEVVDAAGLRPHRPASRSRDRVMPEMLEGGMSKSRAFDGQRQGARVDIPAVRHSGIAGRRCTARLRPIRALPSGPRDRGTVHDWSSGYPSGVGRFAHSLCFRGRRLVDVTTDTRLERVRTVAERVAGSCGLDIFDIQLRRESSGWVLRVVIDRPQQRDADGAVVVETPEQSIGIEDCQRVSTDLSTILDVEDVLDHAYTLEVSSPGLDRPLRHADDYRRFSGRLAKLVVPAGVEGQTHFEGRIAGVEDEAVILQVGRRKERRIPLAAISRARLEVEF